MHAHRRGLTLLEVLVLVVVLGLAAGLLVVLIARQRASGLRVQCLNNLRRVGEASHAFLDQSAGPGEGEKFLPPSYLAENYATWAVLLAPHLQADSPLAEWDLRKSYFA